MNETEENWTAEHFRVTDESIRILRKAITTIGDFLTPEEHAELSEGLAEMVRLRRNAEARSAHIVIGGES